MAEPPPPEVRAAARQAAESAWRVVAERDTEIVRLRNLVEAGTVELARLSAHYGRVAAECDRKDAEIALWRERVEWHEDHRPEDALAQWKRMCEAGEAETTRLREQLQWQTTEIERLRARLDYSENVVTAAQQEEIERLRTTAAEAERLRDALGDVVSVLGLGPCGQANCEGCHYEMEEAAKLARAAMEPVAAPADTKA